MLCGGSGIGKLCRRHGCYARSPATRISKGYIFERGTVLEAPNTYELDRRRNSQAIKTWATVERKVPYLGQAIG